MSHQKKASAGSSDYSTNDNPRCIGRRAIRSACLNQPNYACEKARDAQTMAHWLYGLARMRQFSAETNAAHFYAPVIIS
jgi:hypothetical protein